MERAAQRRRMMSRCQRRIVSGVTRSRSPWRRALGITSSRVASRALSAQLRFGRPGCRRCSTASWWRRSRISEIRHVSSRRDSRSHEDARVIRRKTNRRHMIGDHHHRTAARATLLVTAVDEILGTHTHASSSGESRPAVSTAIASCMAAATVSPGAARTAAVWSPCAVWSPAVPDAGALRAFPRSRRARRTAAARPPHIRQHEAGREVVHHRRPGYLPFGVPHQRQERSTWRPIRATASSRPARWGRLRAWDTADQSRRR